MDSFDFNEKRKNKLEILRQLRLIDDVFMEKVFGEDIESTQLLIRIILNNRNLKVVTLNKQLPLSNLQGRSVRLDVLAVDENNTIYNIEVQRSDSGAVPKRTRYNSSLLDANITTAGDSYSALKETYVIFITENDVLDGNLPIYHIERVVKELGEDFNDGAHIIYVNSSIQDDTDLGRLMHDFYCTDADQMYYNTLAKRIKYFKEDSEGVNYMCELMDNLVLEGKAEGRELGRRETLIKTAKRMYQKGMSISDISTMLDLKETTVKKIIASKNSSSDTNSSSADKMNYFGKRRSTKDKNEMK